MIRRLAPALALVAFFVAAVLGAFAVPADQLPSELRPPANQHEILRLHAKGNQIYSCKADGEQFSWTLKAPEAELYAKDGKAFGKHSAGPSWKANDGSQVVGKAVATMPAPDTNSVPWLLLSVVSRSGVGTLANVSSIQRINTEGGKAPASGCDAAHGGQELRVPYSADYVFFAPQ